MDESTFRKVLVEHYYSKRNIDEFNESTSSVNLIFIIIVLSAHIKNFKSFQNHVWPSSFGKESNSVEMEEVWGQSIDYLL